MSTEILTLKDGIRIEVLVIRAERSTFDDRLDQTIESFKLVAQTKKPA
jgi:hypothetical protein